MLKAVRVVCMYVCKEKIRGSSNLMKNILVCADIQQKFSAYLKEKKRKNCNF